MERKLVVLGSGGNCLDVVELVEALSGWECLGMLDDDPEKRGRSYCGVEVLGPLSDAYRFPEALFLNCIGSSRSYRQRPQILEALGLPEERWATLVHPSAWVSPRARLGSGTVVFANAVVTTQVSIGRHVTILPNSTVSHDCRIDDYSILAGGVTLCGGVQVEANCYLGAGSTVREFLTIGRGALVAMGAVVTRDVKPDQLVLGNPAQPRS